MFIAPLTPFLQTPTVAWPCLLSIPGMERVVGFLHSVVVYHIARIGTLCHRRAVHLLQPCAPGPQSAQLGIQSCLSQDHPVQGQAGAKVPCLVLQVL